MAQAQIGCSIAPQGYFEEHDTWEHHPTIIDFHELTRQNKTELTQSDQRTYAKAYTLHDQHFKYKFEDKIAEYHVSDEQILATTSRAVSNHIEKVLAKNSALAEEAIKGDCNQLMENFANEVKPWWQSAQEIEAELRGQVLRGVIHDLSSYYTYMCKHHLNEVLSQGW
jgi:hypothetical protein